MLKLAYFSPLPPDRTGIAAYSWELLPHLAQRADITLFHTNPSQLPPHQWQALSLDSYPAQRWSHHLPIYHIGNSQHHRAIYAMLRQHPGVVVLHDVVLHHFMGLSNYQRELCYALGPQHGVDISTGYTPIAPDAYPLNRRVLDSALGVIVHSRYAAEQIAQTHPTLPLAIVPMPMQVANVATRPAEQPLTFGCLGQVTPAKQVGLALRVFGRFHAEHPDSRFHIVGDSADVDLQAAIDALPPTARPNVYVHGYATTLAEFEAQIAKIDVVINLRHPTFGETSAAALRALAHGKPVIVFDHGTYQELPDTVAIKTPPLDESALQMAMMQMAQQLDRFAHNARHFVATNHHPAQSAAAYHQFLNNLFVGTASQTASSIAQK